MQAVEAEARRQVEVWEAGGTVMQETRLYDSARGETRSMRSQGGRARLPLLPRPGPAAAGAGRGLGGELRAALPELPDAKRARFVAEYGLSPYDAGVLVAEQSTAAFFETVARGRDAKAAANWVMGDLFAALNRTGRTHRGLARSAPPPWARCWT